MVDAPEPSGIRAEIWTPLEEQAPSGGSDRLIEQYKLYVEMADRISARRSLTNTFFLTINTAVFAFAGTALKDAPPRGLLVLVPMVALIVQCVAWTLLLRSYRQLNSAKYAVIGAIEERLPASPYWRAEWKALGEGRDRRRYWPLSHLERWVPATFAVLYLLAGLTLAFPR